MLCASSASREATVNEIPHTKRHIFHFKVLSFEGGSLSGEWSRSEPTKKQIALVRTESKRNRVWGTCVYVNIHIPVTHNTTQHTPFHLQKKKNGLNFERKTLCCYNVDFETNRCFAVSLSQPNINRKNLPLPWKLKSFSLFLFSSFCFKGELWRLWMQVPSVLVTFWAFSQCRSLHSLTFAKRLEHSKIWKWISFFSFSFLADYFILWICF